METLHVFLSWIDRFWVSSAFLTLLCVWAIEKGRRELPTRSVLNGIANSLWVFAALALLVRILDVAFATEGIDDLDRATGPYALVFWIQFIGIYTFPFILLQRKKRVHYGWVLAVALAMNLGRGIEYWVIVMTSVHRDYGSSDVDSLMMIFVPWVFAFFKALFFAVVLIFTARLRASKKQVQPEVEEDSNWL